MTAARVRYFLMWLAAAGFCLTAGRGMWSSLMATLDSYLSHHVNHGYYEDLSAGLPTTNKREVSATLLKSLGKASIGERSQQSSEGDKVVLFWTTWFGKTWWVRVGDGVDLRAAHCPEARCVFTHDRSRHQEAAAVLFQVR